ncbi:hypothetical protein BCR36DRAFT_266141, partial [Piromyces finnis]
LTFKIDKNYILNFSTIEKATYLYKVITIFNDERILYRSETYRLKKEAERYKEDDEKAKERIESMNELE